MHQRLLISARMALAAATLVPLGASPSKAGAESLFTCHGEARICATIVAGERELTAMLVTGNTDAIVHHVAADAVWTLASGELWTKRKAIAAVSHAPRAMASHLIRADVHHFGGVAIVRWEEGWQSSVGAKEERSIGTDTWLLRRGHWQIIASQEARPPATSPR